MSDKVEKRKVKLQIYEGDPFGGACCGPGPRIASLEAAEKLRQMLTDRNQTVEKLSKEFRDVVDVERETLSQKRHDYPNHVAKLMFEGNPLPYVFIDGQVALIGRFPSYEEFVRLLEPHIEGMKPPKK